MFRKKIVFLVLILGISASLHAAKVNKVKFGTAPDGTEVDLYTLTSGSIEAKIITYGAKLIQVKAPDRKGHVGDVVLGYDTWPQWLADQKTHFGAVVGRYGNRIARGTFTLDGREYHVPLNNKGNALHGGTLGFDRKYWKGRQVENGVELTLVSPDGDMGFPGTLQAKVTYTLIGNRLQLSYEEKSDKPTVVNLTNHTYFNLSGDDARNILDDTVTLRADRFTPVDATMIPTGEIRSVAGTPLDFRTNHSIGERIHQPDEQLKLGGGYDFNWVVQGRAGVLREAATVVDPESGRTLTVLTTEPGVQFYSGNNLVGSFTGRHGRAYGPNMGFCLETQHYPDSPNRENFPSTVLRPGETRRSTTVFVFGVKH